MKKIDFKIEGMTCGGCAKSIRGAILDIKGVGSSQIDYDTKTAEIEYDENKTSKENIFRKVEEMNYKIV